MFNSSKKNTDVLAHWYTITSGVHFSSQDFYRQIEQALASCKLPQLKSSRVEYHEGSVLSDKRTYLRLARERFAFDICAAPFGTEYFFSLRFTLLPRKGWLSLAALVGAVWFLLWAVTYSRERWDLGYGWMAFILIVGLFGWKVIQANRAAQLSDRPKNKPEGEWPSGIPDFDSFFLSLPLIGDMYERIRKDTYYRHDTRLLYHTIVSEVVKKTVEDITSAKGIKLLEAYDYDPIFRDLYKRVSLSAATTEPAQPVSA